MRVLRATGVIAVALAGVMTAGCGSGTAADAGSAGPGIVLSATPGPVTPEGTVTQEPGTVTGGGPRGTVDPLAELDIDDQRGEGSQVVIESLATGLTGVTLVLLDSKGTTVATLPVPPGVQPVAVELDTRLTTTQELRGVLMAPDGAGMLMDDEGEAVEEDFDYVIR